MMKLLLVVVVLGCVVAGAWADEAEKEEEKHTCGPLERIKVKRQWDKAYGEGSHRLEFAQHLFTHFFKENPKARDLFKDFRGDNIYSPVFQAAALRTLNTLTTIIETNDDPEALKFIIAETKAKDADAGIKPEIRGPFRDSLLETLPEFLGTHVDWDAWTDCLNNLNASLE